MERAPGRFLALWTAAALAAVAILLLSSDLTRFDVTVLLALVAIVTLAEFIVVYIDVGRAGAAFTLSEAAITAGFLVVAPIHVVLASAVAMLAGHLPRRLSADKVLFNVSQVTVATSAAAIVLDATPDLGPLVGERSITAIVLGMGVYAAVNTLAFRGLVSRIGGPGGLADFDQQVPLTLTSMLGTVAVGIVAASLWVTQPFLIPLLLVPVLAIQVAARSSLAAAELVASVRAERDRLDQVVRGASDGILLLDEEGVLRLWNPALEDLTGIPAETAIGTRAADLLTPDLREGPTPVVARWLLDDPDVIATGQTRLEARWRGTAGEPHDVQENHALLFDGRGNVVGDVVLVRDVSREAELERLRADFVSRVSHELRTPLTPIRGYVQLLLRRGDRLGREQQREALSSVLERTDHLAEIIEDLLLVTELERGQLDGIITTRETEVRQIVARLATEAAERSPDRRIELQLPDGEVTAQGDPLRLRQAVNALLDNALRYSPTEEPVTVSLDDDGAEVTIRVIDRGPGVPSTQQERIFERFQRLEDPLTMRTGGVGLGLSIARQLAEGMGGRLELIDSHPGHSEFVLSLPTVNRGESLMETGEI